MMENKQLSKIINEIIESGKYTDSSLYGGKYVQLFEHELSKYLKSPTVVVNSGTSALILSLHLAGVRAGDHVIIPAYSFIATKNAVLAVGGIPVYCDIKEDYNINWDVVPDTPVKAVVIVDLYGNLADIPDIPIPIIEDACQALGTIKKIWADFTVFSFYPTKIVNTGEGGAISCQNPDDVRKLRTYPDGLNYRMNEISAAMGWLQMVDFKPHKMPQPAPYPYTLSPQGLCPVADSKKLKD